LADGQQARGAIDHCAVDVGWLCSPNRQWGIRSNLDARIYGQVQAIWFNILPLDWIGEWHPSPALQWVVPLSGRWFIETQAGERVEMGPGDIHWGADIEGISEASRRGHRSGQVGDVACVQMMVQFAEASDRAVVAFSPVA
jgi:hypothetical protein